MTTSRPDLTESKTTEDPFRYGWRLKPVELPDGQIDYEYIPLTLEDTLFPEEGDFIVQSTLHSDTNTYLLATLRGLYDTTPGVVVLGDTRIDFNLPGVRPLGPDVAVIFNIRKWQNWGTFEVAEEGTTPTVVIETTSPETRHNDFGVKVQFYEQAQVQTYIIVDTGRSNERIDLNIVGYQHIDGGFLELTPNAQGRVWIEPLRLWIGHEERHGIPSVWLYDERGQRLGGYGEVAAALAAEQQARAAAEAQVQAADDRMRAADERADEEAQARAVAEQKSQAEAAARAAAEAARAAAESQAREEAAARAAAESQAREEAAARAAAETRLRDLEAELRRLRGEA
jgi:Uma2 family endonuclease